MGFRIPFREATLVPVCTHVILKRFSCVQSLTAGITRHLTRAYLPLLAGVDD